MAGSQFVYVTFIRSTQEKIWEALTTPEFMKQYWGPTSDSDWKQGSPWNLKFADGRIGDTGEILESDPPNRLVIKWRNEFRPELKAEGFSRCTIELEPANGAVKLSITHTSETADSKLIHAVSGGWPRILSNLKSLLETGALAMPLQG